MKDKFPGYFPMEDGDKSRQFETAVFAFDACVLLNVYSYSEETRKEFLNLLEGIQERIWVPYQCVKEFLKNRPARIKAQLEKFDTEIKRVKTFGTAFDEAHRERRAHPFYSDKARKDTKSLVELLTDELATNRVKIKQFLREDPLRDKLASILEGRIGEEFQAEELEKIYKEGNQRYASKIPPGFEDEKKKSKPDCYGDLVFWKEIIRYSKSNKVDMILVTDDGKPDWWERAGREVIGPSPALLQEFKVETGKDILIYQGLDFMSRINDYLNEVEVSEDAIEEVKSVSSRRLTRARLEEIQRVAKSFEQFNNAVTDLGKSPVAEFFRRENLQRRMLESIAVSDSIQDAV